MPEGLGPHAEAEVPWWFTVVPVSVSIMLPVSALMIGIEPSTSKCQEVGIMGRMVSKAFTHWVMSWLVIADQLDPDRFLKWSTVTPGAPWKPVVLIPTRAMSIGFSTTGNETLTRQRNAPQ
jgi:hypothetical protein